MITVHQWESSDNPLDKKIHEWEKRNHLVARMTMTARILYLSPAFTQLVGYTTEELPAKKGWELVYPEDRKKILCLFRKYKGMINSLQLTDESAAGQIIFSDPISFRIKTADTDLYCLQTVFAVGHGTIISISTDVHRHPVQTDDSRHREQGIQAKAGTEPLLSQVNDRFQFLVDGLNTLGIGINVIGNNHNILYQNSVLDKQFGTLDNTTCYVKYQWEKDACSLCPFLQAMNQRQPVSRIIKSGNGDEYEVMATPLPSPDKTVTRALGLFINITERRREAAEKWKHGSCMQKKERLESIGILAGGIAHDLNNILSALVGYPDILLKELPMNSYTRDLIIAIKDSGIKAAAVVQDLLTLARQGLKHTEVVNLNRIISDYFNSLQFNKVKSHNSEIEIKAALADDLDNITGSSIHLMKALMNLVNNAVDAIEKAGTITISTSNLHIDTMLSCYENIREGDYTVLKITDTGEGIAQDDLERIFEPFYTKKMINKFGTGLGLAVVWSTVKEHNGYIDVTSTPGAGTEFKLYFPVTRQASTCKTGEIDIDNYKGNGEKVLVVDDMKEQREIASRILSHLGYFVVAVSNGTEAVEYLQKYTAEIVIVDMIMEKGMDGLDTYMEIQKFNPTQKVIIVSGYSETERVKKAQSLGVTGYIKKPYTLAILAMTVKNCLLNIKTVSPDS